MGGMKPPETRDLVEVRDGLIKWFGLTPRTRHRAMILLEEAKLIERVETRVGKTPVARIIHTKTRKSEEYP